MELADRELTAILKYYNVDGLGLVFDGYEPINPDKKLYYWHNPETGELYVAVLADYIIEFSGNDYPGDINENYWPEHTCNWAVEQWFCSDNKMADYDDYDKWFYWPECGDKCAFAKLKSNVSALEGRNLIHKIPTLNEKELSTHKDKQQKLTITDSQAHIES